MTAAFVSSLLLSALLSASAAVALGVWRFAPRACCRRLRRPESSSTLALSSSRSRFFFLRLRASTSGFRLRLPEDSAPRSTSSPEQPEDLASRGDSEALASYESTIASSSSSAESSAMVAVGCLDAAIDLTAVIPHGFAMECMWWRRHNGCRAGVVAAQSLQ